VPITAKRLCALLKKPAHCHSQLACSFYSTKCHHNTKANNPPKTKPNFHVLPLLLHSLTSVAHIAICLLKRRMCVCTTGKQKEVYHPILPVSHLQTRTPILLPFHKLCKLTLIFDKEMGPEELFVLSWCLKWVSR